MSCMPREWRVLNISANPRIELSNLVFGPSREKRALAQNTAIREFPHCPICKANQGYDVSGSSLDLFKCNACQAAWRTEPLSYGVISSMTLVQPSGYDLRGIELAGLNYQSSFYKNFDTHYGTVLRNHRSRVTTQLSTTVSLEINEEVNWAWPGTRLVRVPSPLGPMASQLGVNEFMQHNGQLYLTSERLIWFQEGLFNFEVPLEDLTSFAPVAMYQGSNETYISLKSARRNVDAWLRLWLWYGQAANVEVARDNRAYSKVRGIIFRQQQLKRERIQKEKQREHVQIVLDFSSIRDTLAKGGVVVTTFNCPQCAGPIDLPETGKQTACKYCGATVKPIDLFDKIKGIVG